MKALEVINGDPTLAWLSETGRAILAVALHKGAPIDMSVQDDAVRFVVAEHLVRREGHSIGAALLLARSDVEDAHLRGIVRFASALGNPEELSRLLAGRAVREISRTEAVELSMLLFASATTHAIPPPVPAQPIELVEIDEDFGPPVGRCTGCDGPTYFGHCTIAMGWPIAEPRWECITPSVSIGTRVHTCSSRAHGLKHQMLREGELFVLCTTCTVRMKYAGWIPPEPPRSCDTTRACSNELTWPHTDRQPEIEASG